MKNIEQFYEDIKANTELQKLLGTAEAGLNKDDPKAAFGQLLPQIQEAGYDFTYEELQAFGKTHEPNPDGEMSLEELDAVAGGGFCIFAGYDVSTGCGCFVGGGGMEKENFSGSFLNCVLIGGGFDG